MLKAKLLSDFGALADYVQANAMDKKAAGQPDRFCKGTMAQAIAHTREGELDGVAASDALLEKFETLAFETTKRIWRDDVCGPIPNVPAHLAGVPLSMRNRARTKSPYTPIMVFVDLFASAAFSHEQIETRGAAILALTRILSMSRPVELYLSFCTQNRKNDICGAVRVDTAPLDLARAAFAITNPLFLRRIMFGLADTLDPDCFPYMFTDKDRAAKVARQMFPMSDAVLAIPGIISTDDATVRDPQGWIIEQIKKIAPEMMDEAA